MQRGEVMKINVKYTQMACLGASVILILLGFTSLLITVPSWVFFIGGLGYYVTFRLMSLPLFYAVFARLIE